MAPLPPSMGERNSSARMTEEKVRALRAAYDAGAALSGLANAFGISHRAARHIAHRTSWRHVK
jgi:transposase-like protein